MTPSPPILSAFDRQEFLEHYWQRQPCLLQGYFHHWQDPITAEELAGLALEEPIEARLIEGNDPNSWRLRRGPFEESDFTGLPDSNWTVLVQALDQFIPEIADLKQHFSFIPSWRIEDVMVSYASPGGGVGPHFDHYDVFLVQGQGARLWRLGQHIGEPHKTPGTVDSASTRDCQGVAILERFNEQSRCVLQPGDVLYVPAGVAHWGKAESPSLCYSVGCRAPSMREWLLTGADLLARELGETQRVTGRIRWTEPEAPGEIGAASLSADLNKLLESDEFKQKMHEALAILASEPKYPELIVPPEPAYGASELSGLLAAGIMRNPHSRFHYMRGDTDTAPAPITLYADGFPYPQSTADAAELVLLLSREPQPEPAVLQTLAASNPAAASLLLALLNEGSLILAHEG